ncbi:MAG: MBL fold metallo-hydrolase [Chloroflexi bacterium]|nr:MBL fold metallo-hydrolase [Chloroflexota bacterium]
MTLYCGGNAQFELVSSQGTRVLIDVFDPLGVTSPVTEKDILLTTHNHQDHFVADFVDTFPGQQLFIREGEVNLSDVTIKGIASSHTEPAKFSSEGGSNYIFLVEMDGVRIAHFGDIGQDELTQEQLDALGKVDIAIMQFTNPWSQMNMENKKGFNLVAQLRPKLIIPTHGRHSQDVIEYALELWPVFTTKESEAAIGPSDLSDETQFLLLRDTASFQKEAFDLPNW